MRRVPGAYHIKIYRLVVNTKERGQPGGLSHMQYERDTMDLIFQHQASCTIEWELVVIKDLNLSHCREVARMHAEFHDSEDLASHCASKCRERERACDEQILHDPDQHRCQLLS